MSTPDEIFPPGYRLGRYEILQRVGVGGMGVVYQARDLERGTIVALKTLHRLEPGALLRLKNEFRFMANVNHPNLVSLHELMSVEDRWFFTMEYIDGEDFWVRLQRAVQENAGATAFQPSHTVTSVRNTHEGATATMASVPEASSSSEDALGAAAFAVVPPRPLLPAEEIRRIFRQIALAIEALHSAKRLHCDIKPRNVLLARDGRVVLVDFGLSKNRAEPSVSELAGTPAYISPEQIAGLPASEASDWFSFGVMLYETLTGRKAFSRSRLLSGKVLIDPPSLPPSNEVPEDLGALCRALLQRDPSLRPKGHEVLSLLGQATDAPLAVASRDSGLIGREEHLAALWDAYTAVGIGSRTVVVHVHGLSGMGKTALVHRFFAAIGEQRDAIVLSGRCYERESVPYKAFDPLIDALARYLQTLPLAEAQALAPQHLPELLRIFPVLRQVEAFSRVAPSPTDSSRDQQELRLRAFRGFKELLARLARNNRVVLHIDDLQWGDQDSIIALGELIDPPDAPRLLLLCGYRTGEGEAAGLLVAHRARGAVLENPLDVREVVLGPLTEEQSRQLAASLLQVDVADPRVHAIAREAHGSPFFVEELVQYTRSRGARGPELTSVTLEQVVLSRVGQLPEHVRRLLELVAVAGRPVEQGLVSDAAGIQTDPHAPWTLLRSANLVRTRGARVEDLVECYHDRIRESVFNHLAAPVLTAHHLKFATLLEDKGGAEPELLALHFRGAGVREKAGRYAALAGDRAANALAFERAAQLYRDALECLPGETALVGKRADALVNAGRCAEAAPLYLEAARSAPSEEALELRRRAAEQYLVSGCMREGTEVLRPLVTELGLSYPATLQEALQGIIEHSIQLQSGGYRLKEQPDGAGSPLLLRQADVAWSASKGLGSVDILRGGYYSTRSTLLSAQAGDARRTARGLAVLGLVTVARGTPADVEAGNLMFAEGERILSAGGDDPYLTGLYKVTRGTAEMSLGHWRVADRLLTEGDQLLQERCAGIAWEISQARMCDVYSLGQLGLLREAASRGNRWSRLAEETGDLFGGVSLEIHTSDALLAADQPEAALEQLRRALSKWSSELFTPQNLYGVVDSAKCELYKGDAAAAWTLIEGAWQTALAANAMGWQFTRVQGLHFRAGAALALAGQRPSERERLLAIVSQETQQMRQEGRHYARASAALLLGGLAMTRGQPEEALRELESALAGFTEADMALYAACARWHKGRLLGGDEGRTLVAEAEAVMHEQGIRHAERWVDVFAPGFPRR
ncbi:protein kinase [Cystobacter fuscus]|uniref:protein kinase domain-containing protein n=1 Tax=Cystobacter fuscus TaxID=43 RepID=UPI0037C06F76